MGRCRHYLYGTMWQTWKRWCPGWSWLLEEWSVLRWVIFHSTQLLDYIYSIVYHCERNTREAEWEKAFDSDIWCVGVCAVSGLWIGEDSVAIATNEYELAASPKTCPSNWLQRIFNADQSMIGGKVMEMSNTANLVWISHSNMDCLDDRVGHGS